MPSIKAEAFQQDLLQVEGIGKARAKELLRHFKTLTALKNAEVEQLCAVKGMTKPAAEAVYAFYHPEDKNNSVETEKKG